MSAENSFVVALYARVSSMRQATEGHSIETQVTRAKAFADSMFGAESYELREYIERGTSGALPPAQMADGRTGVFRPELTRLLQDADANEIDFVVFFSVDRMARDEGVFHFVQTWLQHRDVGFRYLDTDVDPSSAEGSLVTGILQVAAAHMRRQNNRRIKQAWADRFAAGYPPGGPARYGFDWQDPVEVPRGARRGYKPNAEQWRWVRWMFEKYRSGWTTTRISDELRRLGAPRARGGTHWDPGVVRHILIHPAYAGLKETQDGEFVQAQWHDDRVWNPEDRGLLIEQLNRNQRLGSTTINKAQYVLNGIVVCGHCGQRLYAGRTPLGRRQYMCCTKGCQGGQKVAEPVEEAVVSTVRELALSDTVQGLALEEVQRVLDGEADGLASQATSLGQRLTKIEARIARLTDLRLDGELDSDEYQEQKARLAADRDGLEQQIAAVQTRADDQSLRRAELSAIREVLQDFDAVWDALDEQERREALFTVIERAELHRVGDDLELRLKVHFLSERVLPLPNYNRRGATDGVAALTPRELAYLKHRADGLSNAEIAKEFDVDRASVRSIWLRIANRLSVPGIEETIEMAADRIEAEMHALPLRGRVTKRSDRRPTFTWTDKRKQILVGLATKLPRASIASNMGVSNKTIDNRIGTMKQHVGVKSDEELINWAIEHKVIVGC